MNPANLEQAACGKMHPGVFFPNTKEGEEIAKAVCRRCPVCEPCLDYAIEQGIPFGVFGACTPAERNKTRRKPGPPKQPDLLHRQVKDCPVCKRSLDRADFAVDPNRPDGLSGECKACRYARERRYRQARKQAS